MGFDYARVHATYTIPPAIGLTLLYRPLASWLDVYKIAWLIAVAVLSTIPWDSYLIRAGIWSYPSNVIVGPTLFDIPLEEVFFFFIQTYNTSLLYLILSLPTVHPIYLRADPARKRSWRLAGQLGLLGAIAWGWWLVLENGAGAYTGLILVWAGPFLLLIWTLSSQLLLELPLHNTLLPILFPTLYLWVVDTLALRRGTWVIATGTKFNVQLWEGLDVEEALFFLVTNMMIVMGLVAFDNALAVMYAFPDLFPNPPMLPSPMMLVRALLLAPSQYDAARLTGLREAVQRLHRKSRSFYLASSTFEGLLRLDLMLLYSFCRVADDLVDNASTADEAQAWIAKLHKFLELAYSDNEKTQAVAEYIRSDFPSETQSALLQIPVHKLSRAPLQSLLRGFEMDLAFNTSPPITTEKDLKLYSERVAGTVAQMCIELILRIYPTRLSRAERQQILDAGNRMGVALQYVNIARDIAVDAAIGRVYVPLEWFTEAGLTYGEMLTVPGDARVEGLRRRLLERAFELYEGSQGAIAQLPSAASGPIRVAVESYMEIGRTLRRKNYVVRTGRATVPVWKRVVVAWRTLNRW